MFLEVFGILFIYQIMQEVPLKKTDGKRLDMV